MNGRSGAGDLRRALVLSGGPHPFAETTPLLEGYLRGAGLRVEVVDSPEDAALVLVEDPPEVWVCNTLRWQMHAPRYDDLRAEFAYRTSDRVRRSFDAYVRDGGSLLALHAAPICFDDWEGWADIVGARWDWERSSHPALGPMTVSVVESHPLTEGLSEFEVIDEAYGHLALAADLRPLAVTEWGGTDHPVLWERRVGSGKVVTCTLGHGRESLENPGTRRLLRRAIEFLAGGDRSGHTGDTGSGGAGRGRQFDE